MPTRSPVRPPLGSGGKDFGFQPDQPPEPNPAAIQEITTSLTTERAKVIAQIGTKPNSRAGIDPPRRPAQPEAFVAALFLPAQRSPSANVCIVYYLNNEQTAQSETVENSETAETRIS